MANDALAQETLCNTDWMNEEGEMRDSVMDFRNILTFFQNRFSLLTEMQFLRADRLGQPSVRYAVFAFSLRSAISFFFCSIILANKIA